MCIKSIKRNLGKNKLKLYILPFIFHNNLLYIKLIFKLINYE